MRNALQKLCAAFPFFAVFLFSAAPAFASAPSSTSLLSVGGFVSDGTLALVIAGLIKFGIALGTLVIGWILAKFISTAIYQVLCKTKVDDIIAEKLGIHHIATKEQLDANIIEKIFSKIAYYIMMLLVVVAALEKGGLTQVAKPLQSLVDTVLQSLPSVGKAALILVIAYFMGTILKKVIGLALTKTGFDRRLGELSGEGEKQVFSNTVGGVVFWIIMVIGLAGAFDALHIEGISQPISDVISTVLVHLPHVGIAALTIFIGFILGRIAQSTVKGLLEKTPLDTWLTKLKLDHLFSKKPASEVTGLVVFFFIVFQAIVQALQQIGLESISAPMSSMVHQFWSALPSILIAALIIFAGTIVGRMVRGVLEPLLKNLGFDKLMSQVGFGKIQSEDTSQTPSEMLASLVRVGIILIATIQALHHIKMDAWAGYVELFLSYTLRHVSIALLIIVASMFLGDYVKNIISAHRSSKGSAWLGSAVRIAILIFGFTMALTHLQIADNFILLTFGLLLGSLCIGVAIAIGLGGKEVAGEILKKQYDRVQGLSTEPASDVAPEAAAPEAAAPEAAAPEAAAPEAAAPETAAPETAAPEAAAPEAAAPEAAAPEAAAPKAAAPKVALPKISLPKITLPKTAAAKAAAPEAAPEAPASDDASDDDSA